MRVVGTLFERTEHGVDVTPLTFTDEHAASSYGQPVALIGMGQEAYGPADLPSGEIRLRDNATAEEVAFVRAGGFDASPQTREEISRAASYFVDVALEQRRKGNPMAL